MFGLFNKIFTSKIVRKASSCEDLDLIVEEFIDNTYLADIPKTIRGYTLCNRVIMIKKLSDTPFDYERRNTIVAYTLMTMLQEFGNFLRRFELKTDYSWFEASSAGVDGVVEAGRYFLIKIFKKDPKFINIEASRYILKPENWEESRKAFSERFDELNFYSAKRWVKRSKNQRRISQKIHSPFEIRRLGGGCKYSGRLQNRGKIKVI